MYGLLFGTQIKRSILGSGRSVEVVGLRAFTILCAYIYAHIRYHIRPMNGVRPTYNYSPAIITSSTPPAVPVN